MAKTGLVYSAGRSLASGGVGRFHLPFVGRLEAEKEYRASRHAPGPVFQLKLPAPLAAALQAAERSRAAQMPSLLVVPLDCFAVRPVLQGIIGSGACEFPVLVREVPDRRILEPAKVDGVCGRRPKHR